MIQRKPNWVWNLGIVLGCGGYFLIGTLLKIEPTAGLPNIILMILSGMLGVALVDAVRWLLQKEE
jgi:uncharacterized membrane protein YdcZ (DUF606 family)